MKQMTFALLDFQPKKQTWREKFPEEMDQVVRGLSCSEADRTTRPLGVRHHQG
jgi:hypothetical protein